MSPPPISKDLWFAAALSTAALPTTLAQAAQPTQPVQAGVVTATTAGASFAAGDQVLQVGAEVLPGQKLRTNAEGRLHILFLDQSAVTLGPDSEVIIETFNYDSSTRLGQIGLTLNSGTLRVVGGHISKNTPTVIQTPQGKVEISGGISTIESTNSNTSAIFLFGQQMRVTDNSGQTQTITRPGFGTTMTHDSVGAPQRIPAQTLSAGHFNSPSSAPSPNPSPSGPLISTSDRPSGIQQPNLNLAQDRLKTNTQNDLSTNPNVALQTLLGTGQTNIQS